jgi:uncharacterized SAM-binding protein YcdF (DUF218 family)
MKWLFIIPVIVIAVIVGISFYLQPNDFIGCQDKPLQGSGQCEPADAIVVVSGGDTRARTDEGIRLYKNGWADTLVFSGAAQDKSGPSNAAAMKKQAVDAGVPSDSIFVEEFSATTEENAINSKAIFTSNQIKEVVLVTSGYHQRRAALEFEKFSGSIIVRNQPLVNDQDWSLFWWLTPRGWWLATGEIAKIVAFYIQGPAS